MPTEIEEYPDPAWSERVIKDSDMAWVGDVYYAFVVRPTGLDFLPVMIDFRWNTRHGMAPLVAVDDHPLEELTDSLRILNKMLNGGSILVKFHDDQQDGPRCARFPLSGFAEAWQAAFIKKKKASEATK